MVLLSSTGNQTEEILRLTNALSRVSMLFFIIAAAFAALAVFFFIRFRIPTVVGELSGRRARRSINQIRKENEKRGGASPSGNQKKRSARTLGEMPDTSLLNENRAFAEDASDSTQLLEEGDATEKLSAGESTVLLRDAPGDHRMMPADEEQRTDSAEMQMIEEHVLIHTQEEID